MGFPIGRNNHLLAFIHIEKTAGETIKWIFRSSNGLAHCDIAPLWPRKEFKPLLPDELVWLRKIYPVLKSIGGHRVVPYTGLETIFPNIDYLTFIREPMQQCASYFQYLYTVRRPDLRFDEWILTDWPRNIQTKRLCGEANAEKAIEAVQLKKIFIGLQERFDESVLLFQTLKYPVLCPGYRARNVSPDNTIAKQLLSKTATRDLIEEAVSEDKKLFAWVKETLYPEYLQEFGEITGQHVPKKIEFGTQGFRNGYVYANLVYRNLVYKPAMWAHYRAGKKQ